MRLMSTLGGETLARNILHLRIIKAECGQMGSDTGLRTSGRIRKLCACGTEAGVVDHGNLSACSRIGIASRHPVATEEHPADEPHRSWPALLCEGGAAASRP